MRVKGTLFALAACFIWGLIFIIPTYLQGFDSFEIALGRHLVYGLVSIGLFSVSLQNFKRFSKQIWLRAFIFALITNILYYSLVVFGVNYSSPSLTALILGMSPIAISFYGNWLERECHFKKLILPAVMILIGLFLVNIPALQQEENERPLYWLGALASLGSLIAWSWFVVANARFLKNTPTIASSEWSTLMGTCTFVWVLFLGTIYEVWQGAQNWEKFITPSAELQNFLIGSLILGIVCSWVGAFLWNNASTRLPVSLAGQLTIFETIFGLLFFYILEQNVPPLFEIIGITLMLSAIVYSMSTTTALAHLPEKN